MGILLNKGRKVQALTIVPEEDRAPRPQQLVQPAQQRRHVLGVKRRQREDLLRGKGKKDTQNLLIKYKAKINKPV